MNKLKHFIDVQDLSFKEIHEIFNLMTMLKEARYNGAVPQLLKNKTLAMIFEEPSTRTRVSFEAAMTLLGGHAQYLKPGEIHLGARECLYDTAKVLSHLTDGVLCRALKHQTLTDLGKYCDVPVFNGITDYIHPTQAICDVFTMLEHIPSSKYANQDYSKLKVVFIGDATNVMSSTMFIATQLGMNFVHIRPNKYKSCDAWNNIAKANIKNVGTGSIKFTEDMDEVKNADIIYTDLWWWVDQESEAKERVAAFKPKFQVSKKVMQNAGKQARFMHCLPASRNVEVLDEVIDSAQSIVFDQAENRLTAQMALLVYFMYPQIDKASNELKDFHKAKIESFMNSGTRSWKQRYTYNNDYKGIKIKIDNKD